MNQQPSASNVHKVNDGQMAEKPAPGARFAAAKKKTIMQKLAGRAAVLQINSTGEEKLSSRFREVASA